MLPGNSINLTYTDNDHQYPAQASPIVRVDDPAALPLSNPGANPNNPVIGVNFSGGMASVVSQLNAALGSGNLQFSNPSGSTLRVVDNGIGVGHRQCGLGHDHGVLACQRQPATAVVYRRQYGLHRHRSPRTARNRPGLAGRITVNAALLADPSKFTVYNTSPPTQAGDTTRSDFLYTQLTSATFSLFAADRARHRRGAVQGDASAASCSSS